MKIPGTPRRMIETRWLGVTTTAITNGSTTNPVTIGGESLTMVSGDIAQDSNGQEYIFTGIGWKALSSPINFYFNTSLKKVNDKLAPAICSCCGGRIGKNNYCEYCGTRYW